MTSIAQSFSVASIISKYKYQLVVLIFGIILFLPNLGGVHLFDWDEINFAEAAREMIQTGDYMTVRIDYHPFHEKPPVFIWMQVVSMKLFGVSEFAARLPNAIIGIITLLVLFNIGKKLFDERFGLIWAVAYCGSFLPHFYFKSGIIDPTFNLFMFLGVYYISEMYFDRQFIKPDALKSKYKNIIFAGLAVMCAVLTKGPVGYLLPTVSWFVFHIIKRKQVALPWREFLIYTAIAMIPSMAWYTVILAFSGANVVDDFLMYQIRLLTTRDAGHGGPIYYHLMILLIGCFPSSIIMLRGFISEKIDNHRQNNFKIWNIILLSVVVIIFSLVETKIVHYSSLAYFPITFLAAYSIHRILSGDKVWKKSTNWLLGIFGFLWAALLIAVPVLLMNIDKFLDKITDVFTHGLLQTHVQFSGFELSAGIVLLVGMIVSIYFFIKQQLLKGVMFLYGSVAFSIFLILPLLAPKIEPFTQGAPIAFYQQLQNKDCYVEALGFKSYAPYFYNQRKYENSSAYMNLEEGDFEKFLMKGNIKKDAYFVCKINKDKEYTDSTDLKILYTKNGFVFMKREAKKNLQ